MNFEGTEDIQNVTGGKVWGLGETVKLCGFCHVVVRSPCKTKMSPVECTYEQKFI